MISADSPLKILGIAGSLRKGSYNRMALRVAQQLAPEGVEIEIAELDDIPPYNADVEAEGFPPPVRDLKAKIAAADALLIVSPEYNYSIPGVLKNAIDWVSRPPFATPEHGKPSLNEKPVAIMGASTGGFGTVRMQHHLRQSLVFTRCLVLVHPEVWISRAQEKFDADGNLLDETVRDQIRGLLVALAAWTRRLG